MYVTLEHFFILKLKNYVISETILHARDTTFVNMMICTNCLAILNIFF